MIGSPGVSLEQPDEVGLAHAARERGIDHKVAAEVTDTIHDDGRRQRARGPGAREAFRGTVVAAAVPDREGVRRRAVVAGGVPDRVGVRGAAVDAAEEVAPLGTREEEEPVLGGRTGRGARRHDRGRITPRTCESRARRGAQAPPQCHRAFTVPSAAPAILRATEVGMARTTDRTAPRVRRCGAGFAAEGPGFFVWDRDSRAVADAALLLARGAVPV